MPETNGAAPSNAHERSGNGRGFQITPPPVSLPKGGGTIHGIGEKFAASPVTGTSSLTVPIYVSPGRQGFGPQLALAYDSGAGNGPFGFGWSLAIPTISRKTDKGLPRYRDTEDADVFLLSGAEDLVPALDDQDSIIEFVRDGHTVRSYRPRIEGLFARIERWTHQVTNEVHWRSISRENVTSLYGLDASSRIADPTNPRRVFSWLLRGSYDGKGNAIVYHYVEENSSGVEQTRPHERNRTDQGRSAQRYIKSISYGNRTPCWPDSDLASGGWQFQVVFDYDEAHIESLPLDDQGHERVLACSLPGAAWSRRPDPISSYRSGFELRSYRRCHRVLMFHRFEALGSEPYLVRSTNFDYADLDTSVDLEVDRELLHKGSNRFASFIRMVCQRAHALDEDSAIVERVALGRSADLPLLRYQTYRTRCLPPVELEYSQAVIDDRLQALDDASAENLPIGIDGTQYQWVDLDGEGLSGVLTEQAGTCSYKRNISPLAAIGTDGPRTGARFSPAERIRSWPRTALGAGARPQFLDLAGDGQLDVVDLDGPTRGYYERNSDNGWEPMRPFRTLPNIDWGDRNLRFVDLTGDGHADILLTDDGAFTWYPSHGESGFGPAETAPQSLDEEQGPRLVFSNDTEAIYLADMSGDNLSDVVRIRNGEVCYWPNLGYGRFGAKVTLDQSPWFDTPNQFDQRRLRLVDVDGSGTTDILYLHANGPRIYFNRSGNSLSRPRQLPGFPPIDNLSMVQTLDLLGNGTGCLVFSTPLPAKARRALQYVDLMSGCKPHLLTRIRNNLGTETRIEYAPSTRFYLEDKRDGRPWITRLPFPVHCVTKVTVSDRWQRTEFSTQYSYHHGYFDGAEREFRGFGRVDQTDVEHFTASAAANAESVYVTGDMNLYQAPVKTVTWYHTGAYLDREHIVSGFREEYFPSRFAATHTGAPSVNAAFEECSLPEPDLVNQNLTAFERREALRACKGLLLRQETYELDPVAFERGEELPVKLFTAAQHNCHIQCLQHRGPNQHAVFLATESEVISYHYELALAAGTLSPDPRIQHKLNLAIDEFGNVLQAVEVVYPRVGRHVDTSLPAGTEDRIAAVQQELHVAYSQNLFTQMTDAEDSHRLPMPCETRIYDVTGLAPNNSESYFTLERLRAAELADDASTPALAYHRLANRISPEKRLVEHVRTLYWKDDLSGPLDFGGLEPLGLPYETYKLALTDDLLTEIFDGRLTVNLRAELARPERSGYVLREGQYWIRSGIAGFAPGAPSRFYMPDRYVDSFGNATKLTYDEASLLFVTTSRDALENTTRIEDFDYRVLSPKRVKDINDNLSDVVFDLLGMPTGLALRGKGSEADDLNQFGPGLIDPPLSQVMSFFESSYSESSARGLLDNATARYIYSFGERRESDGSLTWQHRPACSAAILRERHVVSLSPNDASRLQTAFEYSNGTGQPLVKKAQAEPTEPGQALRWIASGKTVLNNKGKPVKQYEPYFSPNEHRFEEPVESGVTPVMHYDAVGRLVRTDMPDGSHSRIEFSPWHVTSYDSNDTLLEPGNRWYAERIAMTLGSPKRRSAALSAVHANTPSVTHLDSLGRDVLRIAHNRAQYPGETAPSLDEKHVTFTGLDAEGKPLWIRDARGNLVMQYIRPPMANDASVDATAGYVPCYDIAGNLLFQHSMDSGDRYILNDATGKPMFAWDRNERQDLAGNRLSEERFAETFYDQLHRPVRLELTINGGTPAVVERYVYGEAVTDAKQRNLCGQLYQQYDPSGRTTVEAIDFKGNVHRVSRQLPSDYASPILGWPEAQPEIGLSTEVYSQITEHDALGRMTRHYNWHRGANSRVAIYEPTYNARGLLENESIVIRAIKLAETYSGGQRTAVIESIRYNAKGQRELITYGNGTTSRFAYDPQTFRLQQLRTTRPNYDPAFPNNAAQLSDVRVLQNLHFTYDAVGNIASIRDDAYEPAFFSNQQVEAASLYWYDSLYRLIAATGREHTDANAAPTDLDPVRTGVAFPVTSGANPNALRNYRQRYDYDSVGNFLSMRHWAGQERWTRHYETATDNNRLARTWLGSNTANATTYSHDTHGNMLNLAQVATDFLLRWDYRDMIHCLNRGGGGWVFYQYDSTKQRTRKVSEDSAGNLAWERIYLGGLEIYRRYSGGTIVEEIETLHVFEGENRVLLVEDVVATNVTGQPTGPRYRYQYGNHLGSACLELDEQANIITYEEYHPYGTSAYRTARTSTEAPKRFRYTGMERDEESGLSYHTARYYLPWLGRWGSVDPEGTTGGINLYRYSSNHPANQADTLGKQPSAAPLIKGPPAPHHSNKEPGFTSEHVSPKGTAELRMKNGLRGQVPDVELNRILRRAYENTSTLKLRNDAAYLKTHGDPESSVTSLLGDNRRSRLAREGSLRLDDENILEHVPEADLLLAQKENKALLQRFGATPGEHAEMRQAAKSSFLTYSKLEAEVNAAKTAGVNAPIEVARALRNVRSPPASSEGVSVLQFKSESRSTRVQSSLYRPKMSWGPDVAQAVLDLFKNEQSRAVRHIMSKPRDRITPEDETYMSEAGYELHLNPYTFDYNWRRDPDFDMILMPEVMLVWSILRKTANRVRDLIE